MSKKNSLNTDSLSPLFWRGFGGGSYNLNGKEYIELIKLLKIMRISESGGMAKMMVDDGIVFLNGLQEFRKRAKLRAGDVVEVMDFKISIF